MRSVKKSSSPHAARNCCRNMLEVTKALGDSDEAVRVVAAGVMENFGPMAAPAVPALKAARERAEPRLRFRYTIALLSVNNPLAYPFVALGNQIWVMAANLFKRLPFRARRGRPC